MSDFSDPHLVGGQKMVLRVTNSGHTRQKLPGSFQVQKGFVAIPFKWADLKPGGGLRIWE